METLDKLKILAESAKYDVSCSSSGGVKRKSNNKSVGSIHTSGICHSFTADGRCVSLFKILLSNSCIYDCKYCINKVTNDIKRATFTPREVCELTISFYKRNYIEGLFLSSAIVKNPNYTMELLVQTVTMLRTEYHFKGYIHLKAIPGADQILITKAGLYVDRLSANIELPSKDSLKILAPQKTYKDILTPMHTISQKLLESGQTKTKTKELFVPAGQSTQMIVGASPEADGHIIRLSEELYNRFSLKRVYYSSYIPVNEDNLLPVVPEPTFLREHRLYQADWLLRFYDFKASELLSVNQNFNLALDPKANYALNNMNLFPVNIQTASYKLLLRVPGIGVRSAKRIVEARRFTNLRFEDLVKIGVVMKRAKYFIICREKYFMDLKFKEETIKDYIIMDEKIKNKVSEGVQLSIFDLPSYEIMSSVTGEY